MVPSAYMCSTSGQAFRAEVFLDRRVVSRRQDFRNIPEHVSNLPLVTRKPPCSHRVS